MLDVHLFYCYLLPCLNHVGLFPNNVLLTVHYSLHIKYWIFSDLCPKCHHTVMTLSCLSVDVGTGRSSAIPYKINNPNTFISCCPRTLSRVATPLSPAQQTHGPTHTCLHDPTPLCPSPLREPGRGRRPWRAPGACPTRAEPHPA